ncbi:MAG TPA: hypothetical protein VGI97_00595 [Gemmatimonadaceae bacterium]|jgi:hypothetical protein
MSENLPADLGPVEAPPSDLGPLEPTPPDLGPVEPAAPAPPAEPPAPPQTDEEYAALMDPNSGTPLSVAAFNAQRGIPHETIAKAMRYGQALGLDPESLIDDPKALAAAKDEVDFRESIKTLKEAPRLAALMAHNTALANAAREDLPALNAIEAGVMDVAHGYYARKYMGGDHAAGVRLHDIDRMLSKYDKEEHGLISDVLRFGPTALEYGTASVGGALATGPAAPGGAIAGPFIVMYQTQAGELYARIADAESAHAERDPSYTPLSQKQMERASKDGALTGATLFSVLGNAFNKSIPFANGALQRLGVNIVAEASEDTAVKLALRKLEEAGAHTLSGTLAMTAQAISDDATVQKATTGDVDIGKATSAGVETLKRVLAPTLFLSGVEPFRAYVKDVGRIRSAPFDVGRIDQMAKMVKSSKMVDRAPEAAEQILGSIVEGSDIETTYIGHEALKNPEVAQAVADVVGEHAVSEALATQGSVPMPTEKYLVQIAPDFHDAVREHLRIDQEGASLAEAREIKPDLDAALAAIPAEQRAAVEKVARPKEPLQAPTPTITEDAFRRMAREATEGKRLGDLQPGRRRRDAESAATKALRARAQAAEALGTAEQKAQAGIDTAVAAAEEARRGAGNLGLGLAQARELEAKGAGKAAQNLSRQQLRASEQGQASAESASVQATRGTVRAGDLLAQAAEHEQARDYGRALERAETAALEEADKNRRFLQRYTKPEGLAELGKASPEHRDAVQMLLSGFELAEGTSRPEVARRLATMQWMASEEAQGRTPVIPDSVLSKLDRFVHWKEMTPQEMRDLADSVRSIARQAELKNSIVSDRGRVAFDGASTELIGAANENMKPVPIFQAGDVIPLREKLARFKRGAEAVVLKPEEIVRRLDGGKINGPWGRHLWHPLSEAYNRFLVLEDKWSKPLLDAIEAVPKETRRDWKTRTFTVDGRERTMEQAIAVAMNQGNAGNSFKLLEGLKRGKTLGLTDWTQGTVDSFLAHVNRDGWNFAQATWDALDSHWDAIAKHEESLTGLVPERVVHRGFDRWFDKDGNTAPAGSEGAERVHFRGGYYPIIYERQFNFLGRSGRGEGDLLSVNYRTATTPQGRLQSRIANYARPIELTLSGLPGVIREFAKDVAMRESLMSAHRIVTDRDIVNTLHQTIGEPNTRVLQSMVLDAANDMVLPANGAEAFLKVANRMRGGVSASVFAWNIAQTTQNLAGVTQIMKHVPISYVREGLRAMVLDPSGTIDFANAASGEMATRAKHINAEMTEAHRSIQNKSVLGSTFESAMAPAQHIAEMGLDVFSATDAFTAHLGWRAAYEHAIAPVEKGGLGYDHGAAVRQADRMIRLAISSGRVIDLPSFLRHPVTKLLAPFSGWSATQLNDYMATKYDARQLAADGDIWAARRKWAAAHIWVAAGGIAGSLMVFRGPKDIHKDGLDVGDVARWLGIEGLMAPVWYTPYLGAPLKKLAEGEPLRSSLFTPTIGRPVETAIKAAIRIRSKAEKKGLETEDYQKFGLGMLEAVATMEGMPVVQAKNTAGYLLDPNSPKDNPLQIGLGVAAGKSAPGKLLDLTK